MGDLGELQGVFRLVRRLLFLSSSQEVTMEFRLLQTREDRRLAARLTHAVEIRADGQHIGERSGLAELTDVPACAVVSDDADGERVLGAFHRGELVGTIAALCWADRPFSPEYVEVFQTHRFATVVPRAQMAIITYVRVHPDHRSATLPAHLVAAMWRYLQGRNVALIFGDSQPHQLAWYRALGMRPFGRPFNYAGGGVGIALVGIPCDHAYLCRASSVDLAFVLPDSEDAELAERFAEILEGNDPVTTLQDSRDAYRMAIASVLDDSSTDSPFSSLSREDRRRVFERGYILECGRGAQLVDRGRVGRTVYLVLDGKLQVRRGAWHLHLGRGDVCGGSVHPTGDVYVASKRVTVLCLSDDLARSLASRNAEAATSAAFLPAHGLAS